MKTNKYFILKVSTLFLSLIFLLAHHVSAQGNGNGNGNGNNNSSDSTTISTESTFTTLAIGGGGATPPATPPAPTASTNTCGNKTLYWNGTPPTHVTWFWQTSSSGISKADGSSSYSVSSSGTYYLRAYNVIDDLWSTGSSSIYVTVNQGPSAPTTPTVQNNCGSSLLTRVTPPTGVTWYWQGTNSNGTSTSNSSVTYTANNSGTYYIRSRNNSTGCWGSSSSVSAAPKALPAAPPAPGVSTNTCGDKTLSRTGTKPSTVGWYWQGTNSNGTSTTNGGSIYTATSSGTYYVRSKDLDNGCWGPSIGVSVTVNPKPATPSTPTATTNTCGNKTLTRGTPPGGITWYWQGKSSTGTSTTSSGTTYSATSSGTYYLRSRNNTTGCWSDNSSSVTVTVNPYPGTPSAPTVSTNTCGSKTITRGTPPANITWYWQGTNSSGTSIADASVDYIASSSGTYYLRARNNTSGCWSSSRSVAVTINQLPSGPSNPTVSTNTCGDKTLTRGTPPAGITWYWQTVSNGTSTTNSSVTYNVSSSGTYYLRARNNTSGCWSASYTSTSVTVNPLPSTPGIPSVSTNTCGDKTLTRGTPPAGITWYWHTSPTGTSTTLSGTTYTVSSSGTYYLRAQNNSTGCWSTNSSSVAVTINDIPLIPDAPSVSTNTCGNKILTKGTPTDGSTWYWQGNNSTGTSISNANPTYETGSTGTIYLRALSSAGCWGDAVGVGVTVNPIPNVPESPVVVNTYGKSIITRSEPPEGVTWYWHTNAGSTDETNLAKTYETQNTTTLYLRAKSINGCWGDDRIVNISVTPVPIVQVTGNHLLSPGCTSATLSCIGIFDTYEWKRDGITVNTTNSYVVTTPGSYTLTVTKTGINDPFTTREEIFSEVTAGQPMNSVSVNSILVEGVASEANIALLTVGEKARATSYTGGLGNPLQTVAWQASPAQNDIIAPVAYDVFGRQPRAFLPYEATTGTGEYSSNAIDGCNYALSDQYAFYQQTGNKVATDTRPYSESTFETSPSSRVIESTGPGSVWADNNKSVKSTYTFNQASDGIRVWTLNISTKLPESLTTYGSGELMVSITTDEHGDLVKTYVDRLGRLILKSVQSDVSAWRDTYHVYDRLERKRYTLPPEMVAEMSSVSNFTPITTTVDKWAFQYLYDSYGRMVETRTPGTEGNTYVVYDKLHRPVLSQDANQRVNNQWAFVKYDILGRPVVTGIKVIVGDRITVQGNVDAQIFQYELSNTTTTGYTLNRTYPTVTEAELQSVVYYDTYDFVGFTGWDAELLNYSFVNELGYTVYSELVKGKTTGSKLKIHGQTTWLNTVVYYNNKLQAIQTTSENHLGQTERATLAYDFVGRPVQTRYQSSGVDGITIVQTYSYDHAGRLLNTTHQVNDQPAVLLTAQEYNPLGKIVDEKLFSSDAGSTYAQSVDYSYNIRGWLTSINNAGLTDGEGDLWGMELAYTENLGTGNTVQYTGLVSAAKWSSNLNGDEQAYNYSYDKLNRLTTADHKEKTTNWVNTNAFDVNGLSYDNNGNIAKINRKDKSGSPMDVLSYTYDATYGNRLIKVADAGSVEGFDDGNTGIDYEYDANGNLIKDNNKGISSITYTELNKPEVINYTSGKTVTYLYSAAGTKLRTTVVDGSTTTVTNYVGPSVYKNDTLQYIQTAKGRLVPGSVAGAPSASTPWTYEYYLTDQLGNVRTVFTTKPTTDVYTATMETENVGNGIEELFTQLNETRAISAAANHTVGGNEAAELDDTKPVGPGIIIPVFPGDTLDLEVWGYYEGGSGYNTATPTGMVSGIAGAFGGVSGGAGEAGAIYNGLSSALAALGFGGTNDDTRPAAYLNYIVLDNEYNYVNDNAFGYVQIPANASFTQQQMTIPNVLIEKVGYVFVYVSYESQVHNRVYFDDLKITHHNGTIVQSNDYYPFGMQTASSWTRNTLRKNNRLFNAASEYNEDTKLYETSFRNYDAAIGRFTGVDALAGMQTSVNPYHFGNNNPISRNDPTGLYDRPYIPDSYRNAPTGQGGGNTSWWFNWGSGYHGAGSGDHWSDRFSNKQRDYFLMSGNDFEAKWGESAQYYHDTVKPGSLEYELMAKSNQSSLASLFGLHYKNGALGYYADAGEGTWSGSEHYFWSTKKLILKQYTKSAVFVSIGGEIIGSSDSNESTRFILATGWSAGIGISKEAYKEIVRQAGINKSLNPSSLQGIPMKLPKGLKIIGKYGGWVFTAWGAYEINEKYNNGEINSYWRNAEQGSNLIGGIPVVGTGWSIGWEIGRSITKMDWYRYGVKGERKCVTCDLNK